MSVWALLLLVAILPATLDGFIRLLLTLKARTWVFGAAGSQVLRRWLVLVPSRAEREEVEATLRSVIAGTDSNPPRALLLLDGPDPAAAACANRLGVEVVTKPSEGPSKAATLAWAAAHLKEQILEADAVLILDVGSRLEERFFERFAWPAAADAVQAFLSGQGSNVGEAAARSELLAQHREDRGRERLGWAVRLRGTGTAMLPQVMISLLGRLRSSVEDFEMSLLLAAAGYRVRLGQISPVVMDDKPESIAAAARQRSRWFSGRFSLLFLQPRAWVRLITRSPLQGLAFLTELFSRPLTLTVPGRLMAAGVLLWSGGPLAIAASLPVLASAALDTIWGLAGVRGGMWGNVARLAVAWVGAVTMLPRAFFGWTRVRSRR